MWKRLAIIKNFVVLSRSFKILDQADLIFDGLTFATDFTKADILSASTSFLLIGIQLLSN